ncbi:hypothetical protein [Streptomyces sp. NPDC056670]|uniref:hypothetical protein n=1 Tax=Streptomyces sp. NPDC056670 TaxID=3345904 RepID=UPI0036C97EDA
MRGYTFVECCDTRAVARTSDRGGFEDCQIVNAGNVAVCSTRGGGPEVHGCRTSGGNVGIVVIDPARGRFVRVEIEDLTSRAVRVFDGAGLNSRKSV